MRMNWGGLVRQLAAAMLVALMAAQPARAAPTVFEGTGTVAAVTGLRGAVPTGTVVAGDPFAFRILFDAAGAPLQFNGGPGFQVYAPAIGGLAATAGSYSFQLNAARPPALVVGTGFRLFPGAQQSERVFIQQFAFSGFPGTAPPFAIGAAGDVTLTLTSTFRVDLGAGTPTLADLRDPRGAAINRFQFTFGDGASPVGTVSGDFAGAFAAVTAVPEPSTWALLILGFGAVGAVMRLQSHRSPRCRLRKA